MKQDTAITAKVHHCHCWVSWNWRILHKKLWVPQSKGQSSSLLGPWPSHVLRLTQKVGYNQRGLHSWSSSVSWGVDQRTNYMTLFLESNFFKNINLWNTCIVWQTELQCVAQITIDHTIIINMNLRWRLCFWCIGDVELCVSFWGEGIDSFGQWLCGMEAIYWITAICISASLPLSASELFWYLSYSYNCIHFLRVMPPVFIVWCTCNASQVLRIYENNDEEVCWLSLAWSPSQWSASKLLIHWLADQILT